jgi:micrococcal nuclease
MKKFSWIVLLFLTVHCVETDIAGTVVAVADGDTFTMINAEQAEIKVRLYGVDAPERGQDFSNVSRQYLSDLVFGKKVIVEQIDTDQYNRVVGIVTINGQVVNEDLLKAGLVWHYTQFDNSIVWDKLEREARASRKGLWSKHEPTPPWEFRRNKRKHAR